MSRVGVPFVFPPPIIAWASQSLHDASIGAGVTVNLGYKEVPLGHLL